MKAIVFGELIWDVYKDKTVIGGAPFNFSAHLAHLDNEAYFISAVGNDELAQKALCEIQKHRVNARFLQKNSYPTGACIVTLDENKIPNYNVLTDVSYDHITADEKVIADINLLKADVFYFNTLIQRGESVNALKNIIENCSFKDIFCDINIRNGCYNKDSLEYCLKNATILKISDEEAHYITDLKLAGSYSGDELLKDIASKYKNVRLIAYTLGKDGSEVIDCKSGKIYYSGKPENVKVVSTVGAGDCYGAAFLSAVYSGKSIEDSIKFATERSNKVVASLEAIPF